MLLFTYSAAQGAQGRALSRCERLLGINIPLRSGDAPSGVTAARKYSVERAYSAQLSACAPCAQSDTL